MSPADSTRISKLPPLGRASFILPDEAAWCKIQTGVNGMTEAGLNREGLAQEFTGGMAARTARLWRLYRLDLLAVVALLAAAFAARWPYLFLIPQWTDEMMEIGWAWQIAQGKILPLVSIDIFNGPLFHYLLAILMLLCGPSVTLARVFVMALGVGTVALTYALARAVSGRLAGLLAATLMVTTPTHILVNSHLAWSNSVTPFFTTLALLVLVVAERRSSGPLLVLGAVLAGLAWQTHVSVLAFVVGLVLALLVRRDLLAWLRRPWPYIALASLLLTHMNVIVYNSPKAPLILAAIASPDRQNLIYDMQCILSSRPPPEEHSTEAESYETNLQSHILELLHVLAGTLKGKQELTFTSSPLVPLYALWLLAGLVYAAFRGWPAAVVITISTTLIMPYFNPKYTSHTVLTSRYIAFLVPIAYVVMAWLLVRLLQALSERLPGSTRPALAWRPVLTAIALLAVLALALQALYPLAEYYQGKASRGRTNAPVFAVMEKVRALRDRYPVIYLGKGLQGYSMGGGGDLLLALDTIILLDGEEHEIFGVEELREKGPDERALLILTRAEYEELSSSYPLRLFEGYAFPIGGGDFSFGLYGPAG
jgi:hypothetical protein